MNIPTFTLCLQKNGGTIIKVADELGETPVIFASAAGYPDSPFFHNYDQAKDNARRVVACWNALRMFTTEQIEAGVIDLAKMAADLVALRTALVEIYNHPDASSEVVNIAAKAVQRVGVPT
ncbi:MAG TPA: hypothetical protein VFM33_12880 [Aquabacterium sp.]|nr:hypothetical protein [Aquabacterium sp.]